MASALGPVSRRRLLTSLLIAVGAALAVWAFATPLARADSPIYDFDVSTTSTQAGGHPDIRTLVWMGNRNTQQIPAPSCDCQDPKDITVEMPTGIIGNPNAVPRCSAADFANLVCPPEAQVGVVLPGINSERPEENTGESLGLAAVYNLLPHPGQAGLLGFNVPFLKAPIFLVINSRTENDYGLEVSTTDIAHPLPLAYVDLTLWGVPASPTNDVDRQPPGWDSSLQGKNPPTPTNAPLRAFLNSPTTCDDQSLAAGVTVTSYDGGVTRAISPFPPTTGCDQLSFNPSLYAQPTTTETDTASGLNVDLQVPQPTSPSVPSPSQIRATTVTLPVGVSINPNAADGKLACSDADSSIGTREPAHCPETSKVGTVSVDSSALPGPIPGFIYLGEPKPGDPYRLLLTADGYNVHVKLAGSAEADPQTGQLTVSFQNLPQTPFSDFNMHFFGSERGLLATPSQCGTFPVTSTFTPWDSALSEQTSSQFFTLGGGPGGSPCPPATRPFAPSAHAGVADKTAGLHAPFSLTVNRPDGDQNLTALNVTTPPGFTATLAGVPYCPEATLAAMAAPGASGRAELAAASCPAGSQIGVASAGAGAGTHPVFLSGRVYLAGPYRGAPLSLAVVTPAVSGPYDLGNVVVRAALHVDPATARITAVSDPLPQILDGIPLRLRYVFVNLDRPGFTLNPTNCNPFAVGTELFGDQGGRASLTTQFQIANCRDLDFGPRLNLRLTGGVNRRGHPAIHASLKAAPGESNISRVSTALPKGELLDNSHIGTPCTRPQFASRTCPESSLIGTAEAVTPLLDKPLSGNVYLRVNPAHKLPDIVADLRGQINIELAGKVDTVHGGALRTTFEGVPDAPVTSFKLDLLGGAKGLLQNSKSLCGKAKRAEVKMTGQNGAVVSSRPKLQTTCGGKARHKRAAKHEKGRA